MRRTPWKALHEDSWGRGRCASRSWKAAERGGGAGPVRRASHAAAYSRYEHAEGPLGHTPAFSQEGQLQGCWLQLLLQQVAFGVVLLLPLPRQPQLLLGRGKLASHLGKLLLQLLVLVLQLLVLVLQLLPLLVLQLLVQLRVLLSNQPQVLLGARERAGCCIALRYRRVKLGLQVPHLGLEVSDLIHFHCPSRAQSPKLASVT